MDLTLRVEPVIIQTLGRVLRDVDEEIARHRSLWHFQGNRWRSRIRHIFWDLEEQVVIQIRERGWI